MPRHYYADAAAIIIFAIVERTALPLCCFDVCFLLRHCQV